MKHFMSIGWKQLAEGIAQDLGDRRELLDRYLTYLLGYTTGEDAIQRGEVCGHDLLGLCDQAVRYFSDDPADEADTPFEQNLKEVAEADPFFPTALRLVQEQPLHGKDPFLRRQFYYDSLFADYSSVCAVAFACSYEETEEVLAACIDQIGQIIGFPRARQFDCCARATFLGDNLVGSFLEGMKIVYRDTLLLTDPDGGSTCGYKLLYDQSTK